MQRLMKTSAFMFMLLLIFSLLGCSAASPSHNKEDASKAKTAAVKNEQEKTAASSQQNPNEPAASAQEQTTAQQAAATIGNSNTSTPASANTNSSAKTDSPAAAMPVNQQTTPPASSQPPAPAPSQPATAAPAPPQPIQSAKMTITGPKDQPKINRSLTVPIKEGNTVLDVLLHGIGKENVDYQGSGASAYIRGIENVYQFDYGQKSGWTVSLNGTKLTRSAGVVTVKADDKIEWVYTEDYTVNQ